MSQRWNGTCAWELPIRCILRKNSQAIAHPDRLNGLPHGSVRATGFVNLLNSPHRFWDPSRSLLNCVFFFFFSFDLVFILCSYFFPFSVFLQISKNVWHIGILFFKKNRNSFFALNFLFASPKIFRILNLFTLSNNVWSFKM